MVGVQTNQFPRAVDMAREFRAHGIAVIFGGFHVSGSLAMLPEMPKEIQELIDMGVTVFAGEAEDRMQPLLLDALKGELAPLYDYIKDLPSITGAVGPSLPIEVTRGYVSQTASFDASRGCPFVCSFCTIINVQGHESRWRSADDVEALVREAYARGIKRFFITDDNFARNKNWEPIFDRLIELKERDKIKIRFIIQVDTMCHKIPRFINKAKRAGCNRAYIGLENINPVNLKTVQKRQNRISEYRTMLQEWRARGIVTYCGYILGFPSDTLESIQQDIETLKRELPLDIIQFLILTPLPGSQDHLEMFKRGEWMDPDFNKYDLEHATTDHAGMGAEGLQRAYEVAWNTYYTREHAETLIRRALADDVPSHRIVQMFWEYYCSFKYEKTHPLQAGLLRRKVRRTRRPTFEREHPLLFYPRQVFDIAAKYVPTFWFAIGLYRLRARLMKDPARHDYVDVAIARAEVGAEAASPFDRSRGAAPAGNTPSTGTAMRARTIVRMA
jgi:hypothetical protein